MKKVISMLLVVAMCCGMLVGCGNKTKGIDKDIYSYGVEAVEIVDSYLDSDLTTEEAAEKMKTLFSSVELIKTEEESDEWAIQTHIELLSIKFDTMVVQEELEESLESISLYGEALKNYLKME